MKYFVVDAFAEKVFQGNPAGVLIMDSWLPDETLQSIAVENNLSETAFAVKDGERYRLRWFTPGGEINLCGHATLGTAFVIFNRYDAGAKKLYFDTLSGELTAARDGAMIKMEFPNLAPSPCADQIDAVEAAIGVRPEAVLRNDELIAVLKDAETVRTLKPDFARVRELEGIALDVTAPGYGDFDFVCRCFFPKLGVNEDPVTGRAFSRLAPYWSERLGKTAFKARQLSKRGGTLYCRLTDRGVDISGPAVMYLQGEINI